jgi:hypothetical protein
VVLGWWVRGGGGGGWVVREVNRGRPGCLQVVLAIVSVLVSVRVLLNC